MTAYLAIVRLTCRSAIRSNVFRTLLFFLILSVLLIPNTIKGDGTAMGFIQLILEYSLGFVAFILAFSSVWICCSEVCTDAETGQLQMITVKPVSRVTVLLGKFSGVVLIHGILLLISALCVLGFVYYQYNAQDFSEAERIRVKNEILTGRRIYSPKLPDMDKLAQEDLARRLEEAKGRGVNMELDSSQYRDFVAAGKRELLAKRGEVAYGATLLWEYEGLPDSLEEGVPMFIRYKFFTDDAASSQQKDSFGVWSYRIMQPKYETDEKSKVTGYTEIWTYTQPEEIRSAAPLEFNVPGNMFVHKGTAKIAFTNADPMQKTLNFQQADGPFLLITKATFWENYARSIFVIFLGIVALSMIAVALSAFLSLPTSIFLTLAYVLICVFSAYVLNTNVDMMDLQLGTMDLFGRRLSQFMTWILIPVQNFFVSSELSNGQLIEWSYIGELLLFSIGLRGLPFFLFGAYMYRRRELAIVMKR